MGRKMQNARDMEGRIADLLDGRKTDGPSSKAGVPDVLTHQFILECKHRGSLPKWLKGAVEQVEKHRYEYAPRIPAVVLHEKHRNHNEDLVIMKLGDLREELS